MNASLVKIGDKKYMFISEKEYLTLLNDLKDLNKVLKGCNESGIEAMAFFKTADKLMK